MLPSQSMKIFVGFEYSGIVSEAFAAKGHEVTSCDLLPGENIVSRRHIQGDVFSQMSLDQYDLGIFFPPCTYLCCASMGQMRIDPVRRLKIAEAVSLVKRVWCLPIQHIAIENPIGLLSQQWRKPDQLIYPWYYGDPYSKDICLWLKNLPRLPIPRPLGKPPKLKRVSNHVNSRMSPALKSKIKSKFFPGVARVMAETWSNLIASSQLTIF